MKNLEAETYLWDLVDSPSADILLVPEKMRKDREVTIESTKNILEEVYSILEKSNDSDFESIETVKSLVWDYAEKEGRGIVLWPLRIALTGQEKSMDPFSMLWILGKTASLKRLEKAIASIR